MAYVAIALSFGLAGGIVGKLKGSSFWIWFLVSTAIPFLGLLAALLYRFETDELRRQCPNCGKVVRLHDQVCMRCGEDMYFPDTAIVSELEADGRARAREHGHEAR